MNYLIIMNPKAGRGKTRKLLPKLESLLTSRQLSYEIKFTERPFHATEIAKELKDKFDGVIAFGGDGTLHEVLNGLAISNVPIGAIPIGTGNDFARSCGIPLSLEEAVRVISERQIQKVDLGTVNDQYFCNGVGTGFDAFVSRESRKIERLKGPLVYIWATFKSLGKYKAIPMKIELDHETIECPTYLICVGNGWSIGGGLQLTPHAIINDGKFTICHIRDISSFKIVKNFLKLTNGKVSEVEEVTITESTQVKISSELPLPVHMDGEFPIEEVFQLDMKIIPEGLSVIGDWKKPQRGVKTA